MTAIFANERRETRPYPLIWQAHRLSLRCLTGQEFALTRASAAAAGDTFGTVTNITRGRPRWSVYAAAAALRLGSTGSSLTEYIATPCNLPVVEMSGLIEFIEQGTVATGDAGVNGAALLSIGNIAGTGARFGIYAASNGQYTAEYHNGSTASTSQQTGSLVTIDQLVRLRWSLTWSSSNLLVQLWQAVNGGAEVAAAAGSPVAGTTWGASPFYWVNAWATHRDYGGTLLRNLVVSRGVQTQAKLLEALAP